MLHNFGKVWSVWKGMFVVLIILLVLDKKELIVYLKKTEIFFLIKINKQANK